MKPAGRVGHRGQLLWTTAAALVLVAGGGWAAASLAGANKERPHAASDASCPATLSWSGREYAAVGELARTPLRGPNLTPATRHGCDDANGEAPPEQVAVYSINGVNTRDGVQSAEGVIFAPDNAPVAASVLEYLRPYRCQGDGEMAAAGTPVSYATAEALKRPYRVVVAVTQGRGLRFDRYRELTVTATVPPDAPVADAAIRAAIQGGAVQRMTFGCRDGRFLMLRLD